jgi:pimeloyl-ACP methyl ester carboxylesterase
MRPFDEKMPALVVTYVGAPPVHDARTRFRQIFCGLLAQNRERLGLTIECDDYLWRLSDERQAPARERRLPEHDPSLAVLIVPGAFSDCFEGIGKPYQEAAERLRQMGYEISNVDVRGLSGSSENARIIAEAVARQDVDPSQRLVLLGYSKGTTDILHFLATYPDLADRVTAVLSVAGAVNGSPLADRYSATKYDNWLAKLSMGKCRPGDGHVLDSLSRVRQFQWLATHPLPEQVRYFSLATFARYDDMQLFQRPTDQRLATIAPLNDGQLLSVDQIIPGSALLGYIRADHWTAAVPVEDEFSDRDPVERLQDRELRSLLFEALILFLAETLNGPAVRGSAG